MITNIILAGIFGILVVTALVIAIGKVFGHSARAGAYGGLRSGWTWVCNHLPGGFGKPFLYGTIGVLYVIANAVVYRPYRDLWSMILYQIVVVGGTAIIMAVIGAFVATGLFGPIRDVPWRKIIGVFVVLTVIFNILTRMAIKYSGWDLIGWVSSPALHSQELTLSIGGLVALCIIVLLLFSARARSAAAVAAVALVALAIATPIVTKGANKVTQTYYYYKHFQIRPGPQAKEDCFKVFKTVTADQFTVLDWNAAPAKYRKHRSLEKSEGVTLLIWQSATEPTVGQDPNVILGPERVGRIDLGLEPGLKKNMDPLWVIVGEDGKSTTVNAVYLAYYMQ